jgi:hypothetical protein
MKIRQSNAEPASSHSKALVRDRSLLALLFHNR